MRDRAKMIFTALVVLGAAGCCDDDDDCYWVTECYWDGCCTYCYNVYYCYYGVHAQGTGDASGQREGQEEGGALEYRATARDRGDGTFDVLVEVLGDRVDGATPVSVRLLGPGFATPRRQNAKVLWSFYGVPAGSVDRIEVGLPGTSTRIEEPLVADAGPASPCEPRARRVESAILATALRSSMRGEEVRILAPDPAHVLSAGDYQGLALEILAPGVDLPEVRILQKGESTGVVLDRRGTWRFRLTVLLEDVCGSGSADALVIEEAETKVW